MCKLLHVWVAGLGCWILKVQEGARLYKVEGNSGAFEAPVGAMFWDI